MGAPKDSQYNYESYSSKLLQLVVLEVKALRPSNPIPQIAEAFILLILLLSWQSFYNEDQSKEYQVVEYFAGVARIARMSSAFGYSACAFDVVFDDPKYYESFPTTPETKMKLKKTRETSAMDLTSCPGFTLLGISFM